MATNFEKIDPKASLQFINKREITVKNYKSLPDIHLQQMALCAKLGFGEQYTTAEDFLAQTGNGNILEAYFQIFDVVSYENNQNKLYECIFYNYDNADVFNFGTTINANSVMRKAGVFTALTTDEKTVSANRYIQMGYHGRDRHTHQTAKKIDCEHLRPLEIYLQNLGVAETLRESTWSGVSKEWVYFDCILNAAALIKKLNLGETVKEYDYFNHMAGSEAGLICEKCQDGIMGYHRLANNVKDTKTIS